EGKLTPEQSLFFAPHRPAEELYDLRNDPHEVRNLAGLTEHRATLAELRGKLDGWIAATRDRGATPEEPAVIERMK
ncbi:MAG: atsG, partial [Armatimonadetes bacterium]|nr:atsG [Armatimonadota bacterium]